MKLNNYSSFIHKSRYSRFIDEQGRRENWSETVERYMGFMKKQLLDKHKYEIPQHIYKTVHKAILNMDVMPSMRCMMTAGEALERQNIAGYNCSYLPIDDPKSFDEAMYILLCGTGVGFSVEAKYVNQLPEVPDQLFDSKTTIVVSDSKEGWAKALRQLIALLYAGEIATWDVSKVRPAGSRLKTFGGRASGPEPLVELFKFVIRKFQAAKNRRLSSLECHDILCKIGEVVVVGGVRRSAMISLSDLSDDRMAHAKAGAWWEQQGQRSLANNSAVYDVKPSVGQFMREWCSIYESHSGERGIFNRDASKKQAAINGRRDSNHDFGTNPCSEIILRPYQFCNLTEVIVRDTDTLQDLMYKVRVAAVLGTWQSTMTTFPYLRKIWEKNTAEERLLGVSLTGIYDHKLLNDPDDKALPARLEMLRNEAIIANEVTASALNIPVSAAITCVKPSGTVSQLCGTASGIHPQHAQYYIRRVRSDKKDPLTAFMTEQGIPSEPCVMRPDSTTVFSFPMKAPEGAITRDDVDAISHLKLWRVYQLHWCEHKPSVTISVNENDWPTVGAWVYDNFDICTGVSFLPMDGGTYRQAPYETCSKEEYEALLAKMPTDINWDMLKENDDNVEGAQQLACVAGVCEI
jgi:ribonucleoside-diphosphate reductase alpha chain